MGLVFGFNENKVIDARRSVESVGRFNARSTIYVVARSRPCLTTPALPSSFSQNHRTTTHAVKANEEKNPRAHPSIHPSSGDGTAPPSENENDSTGSATRAFSLVCESPIFAGYFYQISKFPPLFCLGLRTRRGANLCEIALFLKKKTPDRGERVDQLCGGSVDLSLPITRISGCRASGDRRDEFSRRGL